MSHELILVEWIHPNPYRNFERNPIRQEQVAKIVESIGRTGFWDNIVVRPHPEKNGEFQLAYGHNRLEALKQSNINEVVLPVKQLTDWDIYCMMVDENESQQEISPAIVFENVETGLEILERAFNAIGRKGTEEAFNQTIGRVVPAGTTQRKTRKPGQHEGNGFEQVRNAFFKEGWGGEEWAPEAGPRRCGRPQAIVAGVAGGLLNPEGDRRTAGLAGGLPGSPAGTPTRPDPKGFPPRSQSRNRSPQFWQMITGPRIKLRKSPDASSIEDRSIKRSPQRMQQSRAIMASVLRRRISRNPWRRFTIDLDRHPRAAAGWVSRDDRRASTCPVRVLKNRRPDSGRIPIGSETRTDRDGIPRIARVGTVRDPIEGIGRGAAGQDAGEGLHRDDGVDLSGSEKPGIAGAAVLRALDECHTSGNGAPRQRRGRSVSTLPVHCLDRHINLAVV